jgi:hypothetical protein
MIFVILVLFLHFIFDRLRLDGALVYSTELTPDPKLLGMYERLAERVPYIFNVNSDRSMHLRNTIFTAKDKPYLNQYHKDLCAVENITDNDCALTLQKRNIQPMSSQQLSAIKFMRLVFLLATAWTIYNKYFKEPSLESSGGLRLS